MSYVEGKVNMVPRTKEYRDKYDQIKWNKKKEEDCGCKEEKN